MDAVLVLLLERELAMKKCLIDVSMGREYGSSSVGREAFTVTVTRYGGNLPRLILLFLACSSIVAAQAPKSRFAEVRDHLQKAFQYLKANDPDNAAKEFETVLAADAKNAEAYAGLGAIAFLKRDCQNASPYLRKALAIDPSLSPSEALLGICESRLGKPSAQPLLEKSIPRLKDKKLQIQAGLELANLYYRQGNLERTASVMQSLVNLDPDNVEILFLAQQIYSDLADDTLNKLAIIAPGSARMQQVIAERLINAGDLKAAIDHYRKALEMDPRLPGLRYELSEAILESSPTDAATQAEALKELDTSIQTEGDNAKIECQLGRIAFLRSDTEQALAHYNKAFAFNPMDEEAQMGLAKLLMLTNKPQEAAGYLRMAVQSDPLNAEAHYRLSTVCRKLQQTEEADKELRLFQEIKQTKERVRELYREMNKKPRPQDDQVPDELGPAAKP
jgi:tetratricopeptide (TPR) repeat protein